MEYQIKKISNDEIDFLAKKNELPMYSRNSLGISIPYSYFSKLVSLNWYDILFAVENGFLSIQSVVQHSVKEIQNNKIYTNEVLELACITKEELFDCRDLIYQNLKELAKQVVDDSKSETSDKVLYVLLSWVFDNREFYEDPLRIVEFIYDDFGFPKSISNFVRYRPINKLEPRSYELSIKHLFENWSLYLNKQKNRYLKQKEH